MYTSRLERLTEMCPNLVYSIRVSSRCKNNFLWTMSYPIAPNIICIVLLDEARVAHGIVWINMSS